MVTLRFLLRNHRAQLRSFAAELSPSRAQQQLDRLDALRSRPPCTRAQKVLILGAGAAGLVAALELRRLGYEVLLLEAEPEHVGGRIRTYRTRAADGRELHAELGAMRIPQSHLLTRRYIRECGLSTRPFVMSNPEAKVWLRKRCFTHGELQQDEGRAMSLFELSAAERELGYAGLWDKAVTRVLGELSPEQVAELYADELRDPQVRQLDHRALSTALHDASLSHEAREYLMSMMGLETALPIALTEHLREEHEEVWLGEFEELCEGSDALTAALHQQLRELGVELRQGCYVTGISQAQGQARAQYRDLHGALHSEHADWLICTIPLGVLNRLDIAGAMSKPKLRAIQGISYDPSTKLIARSPRRWWEREEGVYGGGNLYDTQLGSTWYPSDNAGREAERSGQESLFLASYTWGQLARRMAALPERELDGIIRAELGNVHASVREDPSLVRTEVRWAWDLIDTQAGAYAFFMPGEHDRYYADLRARDGRVWLAGEHASHTHTWIQGALESALAVVDELSAEADRGASP